MKEYLYSRGFTDATIEAYNIGAGTELFYDTEGNKVQVPCIYFPSYKVLGGDEQKQRLLLELKQ